MKHLSRVTRRKPAAPASPPITLPPRGTNNAASKKRGLPRWALIILCVFLTSGVTWAAFEFVILSKLPAEIIGKWVVVGGKQDGATFDFSRRGTMIARLNDNGREAVINAKVTVEGDILLVTTQHPQTKETNTSKIKIVELTDKRLTLQDDKGEVWKMDRADK